MPIYAYRCSTCGHAQDVLQKISDPLLTVCPNCGAPTLVKQVTAAGFQLKGSGWYVTDFRENARAKPDGAADKGEKGEKGDKPDAAPAEAKAGEGAKEAPKSGAKSGDSASPAPAAAPAAAPATAPAPAPAAAPPPAPGKGGG